MIEIIFTIILTLVIGSFTFIIYKLTSAHQITIERIMHQNEIEKHNLVVALKSQTIQDYAMSSVYPEKDNEEETKEEESNFQNLDEFSIENPELFDKSLGIN